MRKFIAWTALILGLIFVALLIFRTPDTDPAAMRAKYAAAPSRFLNVGNGLTIHYRDTGPRTAPALVLLHGSNASLHTWEPWAARLDKTYRVISLDQIGHGLTGPNPTREYTQRAFVETLDQFTRRLGLTRFALAGNSMGGGVAWGYALAHPDKVSALILIDSVGQPEPDSGKAPLGFRIARIPVLRDLAAMVTPRRLIEDSLPGAFANPALADDAQIDRYWELLRYPGNRQATIDRFATPRTSATPEMLRRLTMPVLIEWGEKDALIPVSSARWLASKIPGSRLVVYPRVGHIPMEESPDASARDAAAFLATTERR
jgi:pimeloyl-ACP methyl ester carboxylesterase